ncbi:MAG: diguanylate cyclase [Selenomonadaceae bacterium]|nr:diguanylate cyclase [Selenomonadaceae bacterium]
MVISSSIRLKLFILLLAMGSIPYIIIIMLSTLNTISTLEESATKNGLLRGAIVSENLTKHFEKNAHSLQTLALNPFIEECLETPPSERESKLDEVKKLLEYTNSTFRDSGTTALTDSAGDQLLRTDSGKLVNLSKRAHFQEAMKGYNYVSDTLISMSTGKGIVVFAVPVKDSITGKPIGMLQRNFSVFSFQEFVETLHEDDSFIIVMDRNGRSVANSSGTINLGEEFSGEGRYKNLFQQIYKFSGTLRTDVEGEDCLVCYTRNSLSDWLVVTIQPYKSILNQVYSQIFRYIVIGMLMLFLVSLVSYSLAVRATRPIIEMTLAAEKIVNGKGTFTEINISSDDELGQMVKAFNRITSARDAYRLESELDRLTGLFNKSATEEFCKIKLKKYQENPFDHMLMAMFLIDLDHFKEANDTYGHQFGDQVLIEFSRQLRGNFRATDCVGRFGGDEFVVIVDNLKDSEMVVVFAREILRIARELTVEGQHAGVTASVGISIAPHDGVEYDAIFKSADIALYHVKLNGRNGFHYGSLIDEEDNDGLL